MTVTVITTLHKDGYDLYGQKNLSTWSSMFPEDWKIKYYSENHDPNFDPRIEILDFNLSCPEWQYFHQEVKSRFRADDANDEKRKNWYKKALRWSFKMYAILHALKNCNSKYLIWIDADVRAARPPVAHWINKCLKNACLAANLESIKAGSHVETGVLIFDLKHKDIEIIYDWIYAGYRNYQILNEEKPWDGIWMAKLLKDKTISWNNLKMVSKKDNNSSLNWLIHGVGKEKFKKSLLNVRSGRADNNELI
jgi:hypothetical protein